MSTRAKIILFSALGALVVAAIAVTTVVLVIHQNHKNDVAEADRVAAGYLDDVAAFREEQTEIFLDSAAVDRDAQATLDLIAEASDEAPTLGDAPEYGRENSDDYAAAQDAEDQLLADLDTLTAAVEDTTGIADFIAAFETALDRNAPSSLLGPGPFADGSHVRGVVIPGITTLKTDLEAAEVPDGFEEPAELASAALQHVLDNLEQMAASLDGGQSYFFEFNEQYAAAESSLETASDDAQQAIADLIEAFGAGDDLEAADSDRGDSGDDAEEDSEDDEDDGGSSDEATRS